MKAKHRHSAQLYTREEIAALTAGALDVLTRCACGIVLCDESVNGDLRSPNGRRIRYESCEAPAVQIARYSHSDGRAIVRAQCGRHTKRVALAGVEIESLRKPRYTETANNAGLIETRRARASGALVSIYESKPAGIDTGEMPYAILCEPHGSILSARSLAFARRFAPVPNEWCHDCAESAEERASA